MNDTNELHKHYIHYQKQALADTIQNKILDESVLDNVLKFHQKTTWQNLYNWRLERDVRSWLELVEHMDILPMYYEERVNLNVFREHIPTSRSHREFKENWIISKECIGDILYKAFGRYEGGNSKEYPSAGALYPVIPLLYVFDENVVKNQIKPGCYVLDSYQMDLLLIQSFSQSYVKKLISDGLFIDSLPSKLAIGYAVDFKRAITKYRERGYRHSLIEVGLASQSFRHALPQEFGDYCFSGFNDNAFTKLSGLSPRLAPIMMLQWFGEKKDVI